MSILIAGIELPSVDSFVEIAKLFANWGTISPLAKGISFVLIGGGLVRKFVPTTSNVQRLVVVALGITYGILEYVLSSGGGVVSAIVAALFSWGGAVALYEAAKPLISGLKPKA